ncbi:MAG: glucosyltransferase domain-containing protein [Endomicrobium sp.]|jgi:hypothetical protein|nr:glucosyltransferase domain-containing protein [Endomicrobium sp.]
MIKKIFNFLFKTTSGLISLLVITLILFYLADNKFSRYIQVGQEVISASGYDSQSLDEKKQKPFEFKYSNLNGLVYSIELSMDFYAYSFSNWQTLFDMGSKEGIIIDINANGKAAVDYKDKNRKYSINFLNEKIPLEINKPNRLEIRISKEGDVISILNGKENIHVKIDGKIEFSEIKSGTNIKNERIFDGRIDNFNLKYIFYEKSYFWQNVSTILLSMVFIALIFGLCSLHYESLSKIIEGKNTKSTVYFENIKAYFSDNLFDRGFVICCIMVFLYILPIIIANVPYMDDYARTVVPHYWNGDSRFLSGILYKMFSVNGKLAVFAPWGLIISSFILCASAYLLAKKFNSQNNLVSIFAVIYLFSSPFLLQPLSFQFDVLPMLFSLIFCLWIFLTPNKSILLVIISTFIFTFCCLLTYQTSIGAIFILIFTEIIIIIKNKENPKTALKLFLTRICSFISAVTLWYFTIYNSSRFVNKDIVHSSNLFISLFGRIKDIGNSLSKWKPYNDFTLIILCLLFIAFCIAVIVFAVNTFSKKTLLLRSWESRICKVILVVSPFIILFTALFGVNAVQTFTMDPRHFFPFAIFLFVIIFFVLTFYNGILRYIFIFLSIIPLFYSFGLSYSYSNALSYLEKYNRLIANSLMDVVHDDREIFIIFNGPIKYQKKIDNIGKAYPLIYTLCGRWMCGGGTGVLPYYGFNINVKLDKRETNKVLEHINEAELVAKHYYYNLLRYKDVYIVDFDKTDLNKS